MTFLWLAVFLAGAILTGYSVYQVVADYLSYPVITYVSMSHSQKMPFPAVTVCNSNPIVCYKLAQFRDQLPELWNASGCQIAPTMFTQLGWLQSPPFDQEGFKAALDRYLQEAENMTELVFALVEDSITYAENSSLLNFMSGRNKTTRLNALLNTLLYVAPEKLKAGNVSKAFDALMIYLPGPASQPQPNAVSGAPNQEPMAATYEGTGPAPTDFPFTNASNPSSTIGDLTFPASTNANDTIAALPSTAIPVPNDTTAATSTTTVTASSTTAALASNQTISTSNGNEQNPTLLQRRKRLAPGPGGIQGPPPDFQGDDPHGFGVVNMSFATDDYLNLILTPLYGACFMFNAAWNPNDSNAGKRISGKTGEETGLSLELFVDQENYIANPISASAGARVTIHSPDQLPNPVEQGYFVQPSTHTVFALQIVNMSRLPSPYSTDCVTDWTQTDYEPLPPTFNLNVSLGYSQVQCERLRQTAEIARNCSCRNPEVQDYFLHNGISYRGLNSCDINVGGEVIKLNNTLLNRVAVNLGLDDVLGSIQNDPAAYATTKENIQKDMLKVEIFFRSLNLQTIQEQPKYDLNGVVSNLGGVFGIYLGMCVVMLIEVLEFLAFLLYDIARHFLGKDSRAEPEENGGRLKGMESGARPGPSVSQGTKAFDRIIASMYPIPEAHSPPVCHREVWGSR
ncbi:unnamed protein product [Darwinula stevensoni]|uniref:Uncharacterized protein n=1 Tax=Darwinula stevensoni TaxID=69355 RepID=A0A7R8XDF1_9CRUS|nr:unnamed protein product [Darwinula stevensoni]CAG0888605.1 unnamed protein product [Darwinula stevensoni]